MSGEKSRGGEEPKKSGTIVIFRRSVSPFTSSRKALESSIHRTYSDSFVRRTALQTAGCRNFRSDNRDCYTDSTHARKVAPNTPKCCRQKYGDGIAQPRICFSCFYAHRQFWFANGTCGVDFQLTKAKWRHPSGPANEMICVPAV